VGRCTFSSKPDVPPVLGIVEKKVDPKTEGKCGGYESIQSMPTTLKKLLLRGMNAEFTTVRKTQ